MGSQTIFQRIIFILNMIPKGLTFYKKGSSQHTFLARWNNFFFEVNLFH
jgi:hypothetical protein